MARADCIECDHASFVMEPRWVGGSTLEEILLPQIARTAVSQALRAGHWSESIRWHFSGEGGAALVMMADATALRLAVQKTLFFRSDNRRLGLPNLPGVVAGFDVETGTPLFVVDGAVFTAIRTAAIAAYTTETLAVARGTHAILRAGFEAYYHAMALYQLGGMERLIIWNRSPDHAEALVQRLRRDGRLIDVHIEVGVSVNDAITEADVVTSLTASPTPLIYGGLQNTVLINAMGSYQPNMREIDGSLFQDAHLFADSPAAILEAGEFVMAGQEGYLHAHIRGLADASEVGPQEGRTIMKSVGAAFYDLWVAASLRDRLMPISQRSEDGNP